MTVIDIYIGLGITFLMYLIQVGVFWYAARFPPKEINSLYGYRTPRSMKNQANWSYANALSNRVMLWAAHIYLLIAFLLLLFFHQLFSGKWYAIISTCLYIVAIAISFAIIEYYLKQFEKIQQ